MDSSATEQRNHVNSERIQADSSLSDSSSSKQPVKRDLQPPSVESPSSSHRELSPGRRRLQKSPRGARYKTAPARFEITPPNTGIPDRSSEKTDAEGKETSGDATTSKTTASKAENQTPPPPPSTQITETSPKSPGSETNSPKLLLPAALPTKYLLSAGPSPRSSFSDADSRKSSLTPRILLSPDPSPRSSFSDADSRKSSLSTALPPMSGESSRKASDASMSGISRRASDVSTTGSSRKLSDASISISSRKPSDASLRSPLPEQSPRSPALLGVELGQNRSRSPSATSASSFQCSISPVQALFPLQPPPHRRSIKCPPPQRPPVDKLPRSLTSPSYLENFSPPANAGAKSPRAPQLRYSNVPYSCSLDGSNIPYHSERYSVFCFPEQYDDDDPQMKELSEKETKRRQYIESLRKLVGPGQLLPTDVVMNSRQNCRLLDRYIVGEMLLNLRRDFSMCSMKVTIIQCREIRVSDQNRQNLQGIYVTLNLSTINESGSNSPTSTVSSTSQSVSSIVSDKRSLATDLLSSIIKGRRGNSGKQSPKRKRTGVRKFCMEPLIQEKFTYELVRDDQTLQLSLWGQGRGFFSKNWKLGDIIISLDQIQIDPEIDEEVIDITHWYKVLLPTVELCYDIT